MTCEQWDRSVGNQSWTNTLLAVDRWRGMPKLLNIIVFCAMILKPMAFTEKRPKGLTKGLSSARLALDTSVDVVRQ